jgi:hypothetical protein
MSESKVEQSTQCNCCGDIYMVPVGLGTVFLCTECALGTRNGCARCLRLTMKVCSECKKDFKADEGGNICRECYEKKIREYKWLQSPCTNRDWEYHEKRIKALEDRIAKLENPV